MDFNGDLTGHFRVKTTRFIFGHTLTALASNTNLRRYFRGENKAKGDFTEKIRANAEVDVGILTIRDDEFQALLSAFPKEAGIFKGRREYTLRSADTADGQRYLVAILRQVEQGNGEAQDAARDMIEDLNPSLLLVVGIAGGLPSDDFTLGDVVIGNRIIDFTVEARKAKSSTTYSTTGGPVDREVAAGVANLHARTRELGRWTKKLPPKPKVYLKADSVYGPKAWQSLVSEKIKAHFGKKVPARPPLFIAGPIASSDRLIKDPKVLFPWVQTARHLLAVEMESGGVYRAARERCPMLSIRGISDIVGFKRSNAWTKYACIAAAEFTRAYLRTSPVKFKTQARKRIPPQGAQASPSMTHENLFINLVKLSEIPKKVFVAPALCGSMKQAWAMLLEDQKGSVSNAWVIHGKNIYSFDDPSNSPLSKIMDVSSMEVLRIDEAFPITDKEKRKLLVWLLKGALRDDLYRDGLRFFHKDDLFAFRGYPDEPDRSYTYDNVRLSSSITVVSHYESENKSTGKNTKFIRHLALKPHFRLIGDEWYLEVVPTYIFTYDGNKKYFYHEQRLSGIKRLEGNRAVLSQVLLWSHLLTQRHADKWLVFEKLPPFTVEQNLQDEELFSIDELRSETEPEEMEPSL